MWKLPFTWITEQIFIIHFLHFCQTKLSYTADHPRLCNVLVFNLFAFIFSFTFKHILWFSMTKICTTRNMWWQTLSLFSLYRGCIFVYLESSCIVKRIIYIFYFVVLTDRLGKVAEFLPIRIEPPHLFNVSHLDGYHFSSLLITFKTVASKEKLKQTSRGFQTNTIGLNHMHTYQELIFFYIPISFRITLHVTFSEYMCFCRYPFLNSVPLCLLCTVYSQIVIKKNVPYSRVRTCKRDTGSNRA